MFRNAAVTMLGMTLLLAACEKNEVPPKPDNTAPPSAMASAADAVLGTAEIKDVAGKVLGTVSFSQTAAGISVSGKIVGLAPGDHGMHLHMVGLCEGPDFKSAGGHWNPMGKMHGTDNPAGPHAGDLGNLKVGADSVGQVSGVTPGGQFKSDSTGLMDKDGAAFVIHAGADDNKTDPSGNSGNRIACGVITAK